MSELSRLRWLCRRGMKELDVVLGAYLETRYADAGAAEQRHFETLLEMQDPELYKLLLGRKHAPDPELDRFVESLRSLIGRDNQGR